MEHRSANRSRRALIGLIVWLLPVCTGVAEPVSQSANEVRGVWLTTTGNDGRSQPVGRGVVQLCASARRTRAYGSGRWSTSA